jgi:predicted O-methyltransferase YrrM
MSSFLASRSAAGPGLFEKIGAYELSNGFGHRAGSMAISVLESIARHCPSDINLSVETGCGKSTILFSRLSKSHLSFALDDREYEHSSVDYFVKCPESARDRCKFVFGPTQATLSSFKFEQPIDVALIDGPHGFPFPQLEYHYLYPHMRAGSLLVLDDIQIPHIHDVFKLLACDDMWSLIEIPSGQAALFRRTGAPMVNPAGDDWWLQAYNRANFRTFFRVTLPSNGEILFHKGGNCRDYLVYGWSFQEEWGRWSEGKEAALGFYYPDAAPRFSGLSLVCRSVCEIEATLNDAPLGVIEANEANNDALRPVTDLQFPQNALRRNEFNLLRFRVSRPCLVGEHVTRQLGIAVSVLRFSEDRSMNSDYRPFPTGIHRGILQGRSIYDGYTRGAGLEFGDLSQKILSDPLYGEAMRLAAGRTIQDQARRMNLFLILKFYVSELPPGDVIEFGTYKGGSAIFMAKVCAELGLGAQVWALDTFTGMPATDKTVDAHNAGDFADTDINELREHTEKCGLSNLHWINGRFEDTTEDVLKRSKKMVLAHIDCDIRSAVRYSYNTVKNHMVDGGYIVFDDATSSSCIGATEVIEQDVIRRDGLNSEQIYPHFVFRHFDVAT